jgi:hypothetical protein
MAASLIEPGSAAKNALPSSRDAHRVRVFLKGGSPDPPGSRRLDAGDGCAVGFAAWMERVE